MADERASPSIVEWILQEEPSDESATVAKEATEVQAAEEVPPDVESTREERAREEVAALLDGGLQALAKSGFDLAELQADEDYELALIEIAGDDAYSFADLTG